MYGTSSSVTTEQLTRECAEQAVRVSDAAREHAYAREKLNQEDRKLNDLLTQAVDNGFMKVGGAYLTATNKVVGIICRDEKGVQSVILELNKQ